MVGVLEHIYIFFNSNLKQTFRGMMHRSYEHHTFDVLYSHI
jgi:hypothetical protein